MPRRYTDQEFIKAFWKRVKIVDYFDCWEWQAARNSAGYGHVGRAGKHILCHRLAWGFTYGQIPYGLCVLHKCDNPLCCNPNHLFLGTIKDNVMDMMAKGRQGKGHTAVGEQCMASRLKREQIVTIRTLKLAGMSAVQLAKRYDVTRGHIHKIVTGESWGHVV